MKTLSFFSRLGQLLDRWTGGADTSASDIASLGRRHPKALRAFMIRELAETAHGLQGLEKDASHRLVVLAKRLRSLDDTALVDASPELFSELAQARRTMQRLQLATQPTHQLVEEWSGWQELKRLDPQDAAKPYKAERMELVRSELSVRGVNVQGEGKRVLPATVALDVHVEQTQPVEDATMELAPKTDTSDLLDEWMEERDACGDDHVALWQEAFRLSVRQFTQDAPLAVATLKHHRALQGEQKRHDKVRRIKRHRLAVFE